MSRRGDLLEEALDASGGLETWRRLTQFKGHLAGGGPLFDAVGQPDGIRDLSFEGQCQEQLMSCWPMTPARYRSRITPDHEAFLNQEGKVVQDRRDPEKGFVEAAPGELARWDNLNVAWFIGYGMWNYLSVPFLWTWSGVETIEIAPAESRGLLLRRLLVRYPDTIATHSREETFYFSDSGLIVRVDYAPIVTGGRLAANFASDHARVPGGLIVPLRRVVHTRHSDGSVAQSPIIDITIDRVEYM